MSEALDIARSESYQQAMRATKQFGHNTSSGESDDLRKTLSTGINQSNDSGNQFRESAEKHYRASIGYSEQASNSHSRQISAGSNQIDGFISYIANQPDHHTGMGKNRNEEAARLVASSAPEDVELAKSYYSDYVKSSGIQAGIGTQSSLIDQGRAAKQSYENEKSHKKFDVSPMDNSNLKSQSGLSVENIENKVSANHDKVDGGLNNATGSIDAKKNEISAKRHELEAKYHEEKEKNIIANAGKQQAKIVTDTANDLWDSGKKLLNKTGEALRNIAYTGEE